jgi:ubiquinone/menaquinone biosynthesis C-methylase UbiE
VTQVSGYDAIAHDYARAFRDELERKPFDRGVLQHFAQLVRESAAGPVLDAGCGPGEAAAELAAAGLDILAVDRSIPMVRIGQQRLRDVRFAVADMAELPLPDCSVGGVCSWYSIVHTPTDGLLTLFREFARVLTAGGWIALAFQTNAPTLEFTTAFGHDVDLRFLRHDVDHVVATLRAAGLTPHRYTVRPRGADLGETADQAFVIAGRSGAGGPHGAFRA